MYMYIYYTYYTFTMLHICLSHSFIDSWIHSLNVELIEELQVWIRSKR